MAIFEPVDQQATTLDQLFRAHRADLVALCRRRLGPGPDAEDAAHEAMLRAWRARESLDEGRDAWPWLATIAGRVCIDVQRRRSTARAYVAPRADLPLGPEDHVVRSTHDGLLRDALDQLSPSRREALLLREVEDWDYGRIAAHQRKSPGSVRTAVTRARQELRDQVELLARSRDQWPLAGVMGGLVARTRSRFAGLRSEWSSAVARSSVRMDGTWESVTAAASSGSSQLAFGGLLTMATLFGGASGTAPTQVASAPPVTVLTPAVPTEAVRPPSTTASPDPTAAPAAGATNQDSPSVAPIGATVPAVAAVPTIAAPPGLDSLGVRPVVEPLVTGLAVDPASPAVADTTGTESSALDPVTAVLTP